ncbi:MAG: InlB B-repeat-containing protein, partial [Acidimicrobiia bacterium]|nr:InlB B-repeat-containing protein [Acidimicrobiia bacterium]
MSITPVNSRRLTVSVNGSGLGAVESTDSPQTINCTPKCTANYTTGSSVTLTATTAPGSRFAGWSGGGCSGNASTCTVTMNNFQSVTATFNTLRAVTIQKQNFGGQGDGTVTSSPPGFLTCGANCIDYDQGTSVTLTATPDSTSLFRGWETGGQTALTQCQGQLTPCTFTPTDRDLTIYANFASNVLTVGKNGAGSGTIVSSPTGISCGTTCSHLYPWGTQVTLVATPDTGSHFQWASYPCDTATTNTCTFTMDSGSRTVIGSFVKNQETLSVNTPGAAADPPAFGNVTSSPAGINCQLGCGTAALATISSHDFEQFSQVTLTATPRSGTTNDTTFTGWGGACATSGTSPTCTVTMDTAKSVTANFALIPRYTLTVSAPNPPTSGTGTVTSGDSPQTINCGVTCSNVYYSGAQVTLTATPDSATSQFDGWGGACTNTTGTCTVTMSQARTVSAKFSLVKHTLNVSTAGTGTGEVTSTFFKSGGGILPDESVDINCGTTCSGSYDHGDPVTLNAVENQTALSDVNSTFAGWSGACTNTTGSCQVTMDQARSVTATFTRNTHELDVGTSGVGTGTVTSDVAGVDGNKINCGTACAEVYDTYKPTGGGGFTFTAVTLTATPNAADSRFTGWTGACAGNVTNTCFLTMDQVRNTTATFDLNRLTVTKAGGGSGTVTSGDVPQSINCGVVCAANFPANASVTLTAAASSSPLSTFGAWTDGNGVNPCTNPQPQPTCVVTMSGARTVQATFTTNAHVHVVLAGSGAANGQVFDEISGGINCGLGNTSCDITPVQGSSVTLHSNNPTSNSTTFDGWSGPCSGTGDCTFTANDAVTVTATFTLHTSTLTVSKTGTGGGTVTSTDVPSTITCGTTCTHDYPIQTPGLALTASPDANSDFIGWSGDCTPSGNICRIADLSAARNVSAEFEPIPSYTLTVSPTGTGRSRITSDVGGIDCPGTCSTTVVRGTVVTLSETPDNSTFGGWGNGCNGGSQSTPPGACAVRLSGDATISPSFILKTIFLQVNSAFDQPPGTGTVTSSPSGINCTVTGTSQSGTCGASFESGTNVTLTATPSSNAQLHATTGAGNGTWTGVTCIEGATAEQNGVCTVYMDPRFPSGQTAQAKFTHNPVALNVDATGGTGTGSVSIQQNTTPVTFVNCQFQCVSLYPQQYGGIVVLTATPDTGNVFSGWSGLRCAALPSPNQCWVQGFNNDQSIKASFSPKQQPIQVRPGGSTGGGSITSTPAGFSNCTGTCNSTFDQGSLVTLTATPDSGSQFMGWSLQNYSGSCPDTSCTLTLPQTSGTPLPIAATANWQGLPRTITAAKNGTGTGTVSTVNAPLTSINCGTTCSGVWPNGLGITLDARADPGSTFAGWTNCPNVLTPAEYCRVNINSDLTVTATFNLPQRTLTVTPAGTGTGTVTSDVGGISCGTTCSHDYDSGTQVTLSATYDPTSTIFEGWSGTDAGACAGTTVDCTLTMDAAKSVTATFNFITHGLTVTPAGTGTGTVTSGDSPQTIDCGTTCGADYNQGTQVTLSASPSADSSFDGWSGDCTNTTGDCVVTMDGAKSVTATFTHLPVQQLGVSKTGNGSGDVTSSPTGIDCGSRCSYLFNSGTPVTLSPTPADSNSVFNGWSGDCTGTGTCQVTMS